MVIISRKYLYVYWGAYSFSMRVWRFRRNRRSHSVYLQIGPLEIVVWYR